MQTEIEIRKIERTIKLLPIFTAITGDLIFFVPIDSLFLTLAKGLNPSQITAISTISLFICILLQKIILKIAKKIGNVNAQKVGVLLLLLSSIILTFARSFYVLILYSIFYEIAYLFWNLNRILLKNNLTILDRQQEYYTIRNQSKILYAIATMVTAVLSGYLFNINFYLPMYISIILCAIMLLVTFSFYEGKFSSDDNPKQINADKKSIKMNSLIFMVILSNATWYPMIKVGQSNSKLFMQYVFQNVLSIEMVTYYISSIVLFSRVARLVGNVLFGKVYLRIRDKISVVLSVLATIAFSLLIMGYYLTIPFIYKVIMMSFGFFIILGIRDSFQVYIEDTALNVCKREEQQKIMLDIEITRKIGILVLSSIFTLILMRYKLIVVEWILVVFAVLEIILNIRLYNKLQDLRQRDYI